MPETVTRRITYQGNPTLARALVRLLEEEGLTVRVRREGRPATEYRDAHRMPETVLATLLATGAAEEIDAAVRRFGERFPGGRASVEGEGGNL